MMMTKTNYNKIMYKQDALRNLAEKYYSDDNASFEKIKNKEITPLFMMQYKYYFKHGKKVSINANGETSDGKSTLMAELVRIANEECIGKEMSEKYIVGNQQEYMQWIRDNSKKTNIMLQIDEWSSLADTGENATTEMANFEEISNIDAQTFIHTGSCSPKEQPDKNAFIHLQVASRGRGSTQAYVYYNLLIAGTEYLQIIGHININVMKTLNAQWYQKYRRAKFKRIALRRKEGIYHERELTYAKPIQEIIDQLINIARYGKISERRIQNKVELYTTKHKLPMSILGIKEMTGRIKGILDLYKDLEEAKKKLNKKKHQFFKGKGVTEEDKQELDLLEEAIRDFKKEIGEAMEWIHRKAELYKEYKEIR